MAINDYSKVAFTSLLNYMQIHDDYTVASGGGSISHNLGYVPFFFVFGLVDDTLVHLKTGNVEFPGSDFPAYVISATDAQITIDELSAPATATTYHIRVYKTPLPS